MRGRAPTIAFFCSLHVLTFASVANAGIWDLNLGRLCQLRTDRGNIIDCGGYNPNTMGPLAAGGTVVADNAAFRSLMSELGVIFTPNILSPAETYGYNGYSLGVEFGFTTVNPKKNANSTVVDRTGAETTRPHRYWRAAESVSDKAFSGGNIQDKKALELIERDLPPSIAPTISIVARKGLWLPLPSFEIGLGVRHLLDSKMWAGFVEAKFALHEGFQGWPLPALAVRGTGSRIFGTPGFNLTVAGLDFSISKHFGVASTFNLMPYVGYQLLWIIADSGVIDATPNIDAVAASIAAGDTLNCSVRDCRANFTFDDQSDIIRHRFFIGMRFNFYLFSFLAEYSYFAAGRESDAVFKVVGGALKKSDVPDDSGEQHAINFSLVLDY